MRWVNRLIALAAVLSIAAVATMAQAKECTEEFKTATYSKWYDNRKENQDVAYEAAKEYVAVCPTDDSQYATTVKKFIADYDKIHSNQKLATDFETAVKAKNYAEQIRLGKQLAASPSNADNAVIYVIMASAGLGDPNLLSESAVSAKKAIELIEAGKPVTPAYQTKDQALAAMNYVIAKSIMKTSPTDAIAYFIKAAKYESDLKKSPLVYNELATAYAEGPVAKFGKDYQTLAAAGKSVDSPEAKLVVANLNQALDRQIDAFARAAAVSTSPEDKKAFMGVLAAVYKDRNKKDPAENELNTLVASALSKPLPDAPTPITSLPEPAATPTPASGTGGSNTTGGAAPGGSTTNGSNSRSLGPVNSGAAKTGTTTTTAPPPATAKPSPTPKPKQRRSNHRGR
jgi:hypothetical protein